MENTTPETLLQYLVIIGLFISWMLVSVGYFIKGLKKILNNKPQNQINEIDIKHHTCPECNSSNVLDWVYDDELYCGECENRWPNK
mgnify:CR=1 FL=1